ncbi:helix-turn-helix domain-containing protein [Pseudomonas sp. ICMP22404]|uniref:helix-turn-helix domain-containing protein n=1 Tax=Pseudomonas sp. ICMP22404 TaxID=2583807 RepID=UPI00111A3D42|nr:helix-turn-helix transcriptional regulator [Pseudomonas sp. ICMP22404]TNF83507.1 helix-turn-helix domain-containing protein [Pseudomonas sp. ICMP22404]
MSLKIAFAAVLKAMRASRGLTQRNLAEVSSRTYVSKLERGYSSPTLEMLTTLSGPLNVNPLTLIAITLSAESGESVSTLLRRAQEEVTNLAQAGVLNALKIAPSDELIMESPASQHTSKRSTATSPQTEFCFAE